MNKQEFMAISLPYGVKCEVKNQFGTNEVIKIDTISIQVIGSCGCYYKTGKPILHPLSDLIKEIEHNGETFTTTDITNNYLDRQRKSVLAELENMAKHNYFDGYLPFYVCEKLIEYHFDICGLIEKGEAIDVNTLEVNPYK